MHAKAGLSFLAIKNGVGNMSRMQYRKNLTIMKVCGFFYIKNHMTSELKNCL